MNIWRLTISTDAKEGVDPREFCIDRSILGVGWPVAASDPLDWETYERLGTEEYYNREDKGWWPALNAIRNRMREGDLCWTRDWNGQYHLGRVDGPWEYRASSEYTDADVVNVRSCRWVSVGTEDSVPGKVLNSFRARRALQAVHDETVRFYSMLRYNQALGHEVYALSESTPRLDLFALVSPEDCEDIVGLYLQEAHDYRLIPSTCKFDTFKTEFVLRKKGGIALAQVKQGEGTLDRSEFEYDQGKPCDWFLFTTGGHYQGAESPHVHCLDPDSLREFAVANVELMSERVQRIIEFCEVG